jgi:catechol 2,3-dioxygenase-like lactoylglutathione lyase family enzyme
MITNMAHACFTVTDLDRAQQFYADGLGLTPAFDYVDENGRRYGLYLYLGGRSFIELFTGELGAAAQGQSFRHICLEVDDMQATVAQLRGRGIEVTEPKLGKDRSWQAWVTDPDGNWIELHDYNPDSKQTPWVK